MTTRTRRRGGLFVRIYLTLLVTVMLSAITVGVGSFMYAGGFGSDWVEDAVDAIEADNDTVAIALDEDPDSLPPTAAALSDALGADVGIYDRQGHRVAGQGRRRIPKRARRRLRQLERGRPVLDRPGRLAPPTVIHGVFDPDTGMLVGVAVVVPKRGQFRRRLVLGSGATLIVILAAGAYLLSRGLTQRLSRLEAGADRIANGDFDHRIAVDGDRARDEIDEVAFGFNEMAGKVATLLRAGKALLANVSHELRTPIARIKVVSEILGERVDAMDEGGPYRSDHVQRLRKGLSDMQHDVAEVETLVSDLLTGGRLELGDGSNLELGPVQLSQRLPSICERYAATCVCPEGLTVTADGLLVERLVRNLLGNARRACPDGEITVTCRARDGGVEIAVEDEGPGIPPDRRQTVFEPFRRLDAARDRDRGGVGLGLYLCRQICAAHGGTIGAADRLDGRGGARLWVWLPAAGPARPPEGSPRGPAATLPRS